MLKHNLLVTKWKWTIVAVVLLAAAWFFRAPLLGGLASPLIVDQPPGDFNCICISSWGRDPDGDRCYDKAAQFYSEKPRCRVLLIEPWGRLESIGAVSSFESISRRELTARDVPREAISVIRGRHYNDRANARSLAAWLDAHSKATVLLLCSQFRSAVVRRALDAELTAADAARVRLVALPDRRVDAANWWTSRGGLRSFGASWLLWIHSRLGGEESSSPVSADDYQREFLDTLRERTP